jgi:hypothetical protein
MIRMAENRVWREKIWLDRRIHSTTNSSRVRILVLSSFHNSIKDCVWSSSLHPLHPNTFLNLLTLIIYQLADRCVRHIQRLRALIASLNYSKWENSDWQTYIRGFNSDDYTGCSTRTWASQYRQNKTPFLDDVYLSLLSILPIGSDIFP